MLITEGDAMANDKELFTTRSGKQVEIPEMRIPKDVLISAMRLQEDMNRGTGKYTLKYVVLMMFTRGESAMRNSMKYRIQTTAAKQVNAYIKTQLACGLPIDREHIAKLNGMSKPEPVEDEDVETILDGELTDVELDAATSPTGTVS